MADVVRDVEMVPASVVLGQGTEADPCQVGCVGHPGARVVRIVHVSDTHEEELGDIPSGDILIHSGDYMSYKGLGIRTFLDAMTELDKFFAQQPHKHKIFVAGNHEMCMVGQPIERIRARLPHAIYLQDNAVLVEGLKIYGSPWSGKRKSPANAFICPYPELGKYWVLIPKDTDILVTHSPPHRIMDNHGGMGCPLLRELVLKQIRPLAHLFGHAHQGTEAMEKQGVLFSNAAQYGREDSQAIVIDVYVAPSVPAKTKTYRPAVWREEEDGGQAKPQCVLL